MTHQPSYIPALGHDALTPLYDPGMIVFPEKRFKGGLIAQARLAPDSRVLDIGCGTGTLALMVKRAYPQAEVTGLDGDPKILERARRKAVKTGLAVTFDHALADALPYPDGAFDRVFSTLMIHHLDTPTKSRMFAEVWRVLRPGGEFHVGDFGPPAGVWARLTAFFMRRWEQAGDNLAGRLPALIGQAGFDPVEQTGHVETLFGTLRLIRAVKPPGNS